MNTDSELRLALQHGENLLNEMEHFSAVPGLPLFRQRLERALRQARSQNRYRPVNIALVGGTGAGKSELFNALLGAPGASPTSHAERIFTRRVHLAVHPSESASVPLPAEIDPVMVEHGIPGLALMDTPDLDGALPENRHQARLAIEAADIVVYVALPEKRSSFVIQQELQEWAARKHWFFVLNQVDLCSVDDLGSIRQDFTQRIAELGFEASHATLFLVSAKQADHPYSELQRLRSAVYSSRTSDELRSLQEIGIYRALTHAADQEVTRPLDQLNQELHATEEQLNEQIRQLYTRILSPRSIRDNLSDLVRSRVWRQVPSRVGGFLALPLWIMGRFHQIWLTFSLSRLAAGGFSLLGMFQAVWITLLNYVRGIMPIQALLAAFRRQELESLKQLRLDAVRKLEDLGVPWEDPTSSSTPKANTSTSGSTEPPSSLPRFADWFESQVAGANWSRDPDRAQLMECLMEAVDRSAAEGAGRAVGKTHKFFGNLLPLILFIDLSRKTVLYWLSDTWLPGSFYLMALFLFAISTMPGCFLVGAGIRARARIGSAEEIVSSLDQPWETAPLRDTRFQLERLCKRIINFRRLMEEHTRNLSKELRPEKFGARLTRDRLTGQSS